MGHYKCLQVSCAASCLMTTVLTLFISLLLFRHRNFLPHLLSIDFSFVTLTKIWQVIRDWSLNYSSLHDINKGKNWIHCRSILRNIFTFDNEGSWNKCQHRWTKLPFDLHRSVSLLSHLVVSSSLLISKLQFVVWMSRDSDSAELVQRAQPQSMSLRIT